MTKAASDNEPKAKHVQDAVKAIEKHGEELESQRGAYMNRCGKIRKQIASVYDLAKENGIPKKELRGIVKERELLRKVAAVRDDMEDDEQNTFDMLKTKLGDLAETPLGQAALARSAKKNGNGSKHLDDMTGAAH